MGAFDAMDKPGTDSRPGYLGPGKYLLTITSVRSKPSENPKAARGTNIVIAEFVVAESTNPEIRIGETRSWVSTITPDAKGDRAAADVKCLLFAVLGVDPSNKQAVADFEGVLAGKGTKVSALFGEMTGEANPLAGQRLRVECTAKKTGTGGDFTVHNWKPAGAAALAAGAK